MDLLRTIQETATWIEKVNHNFELNFYRSPELSPKWYYHEIPDAEKMAAIHLINSKRRALLGEKRIELIPVSKLENYGRVMFFDANDTVMDGAPEVESACYVDIGDAPPWDTWVATGSELNAINFHQIHQELTDNLLIAWVPSSQYYYADQAIEVACLDNFAWPSNEFINDEYAILKPLFQKPVITKPETAIDMESRMIKRNTIMAELEANSKTYWDQYNKAKRGC